MIHSFLLPSNAWLNAILQLEERREKDPQITLSKLASLEERKAKFERSASVEADAGRNLQPQQQRPSSALGGAETGPGRKFSLPANINQHLIGASVGGDGGDDTIGALRSVVNGHAARSRSLNILRTSGGRIHIARPWLKKKSAAGGSEGEEEEEENHVVTEESSGM